MRATPDLTTLCKQLENPQSARTDYYLQSYDSLIATAARLMEQPDAHTLAALGTMAYGWMPTVPRHAMLSSCETQKQLENVQKVTSLKDAACQIESIAHPLINRSWVGTSKLFHFINPTCFPIWDSRIARHFGYSYRAANPQTEKPRYIAYIAFMERNLAAASLCSAALDKYAIKAEGIRAIELLLFLTADTPTER